MALLPLRLVTVAALVLTAPAAMAQNLSSSGASWNTSWGFASTADRQLGLAQAQTIRNARAGNPSTVVNHVYDNRQNYIDYGGSDGAVISTDFHAGDNLTNTNTIGAMNTGSTNIVVEGEHNTVTAAASADSKGCQDGSVGFTIANGSAASSMNGYSVSFTGAAAAKSCN